MPTKSGDNGNNKIVGSFLRDRLNGLGGDDHLIGGGGGDTLDGGPGSDWVDYAEGGNVIGTFFGLTAVDVDLTRTTQRGGDAEGDEYISIENVAGSAKGDAIRGNAQANILYGNGGSDLLEGREGNDILIGDNVIDSNLPQNILDQIPGIVQWVLDPNDSADVLLGGAGADQLFGGIGDDLLEGGSEGDNLFGDSGNDTASYSGSSAGVSVSLVTGLGSGGDATDDVLVSIENLIGSAFNDTLIGTNIANEIHAGGGDDFVDGGAGADVLDGGSGVDTITYRGSNAGVAILLNDAPSVSTGGFAQGDTISNFENALGSQFADVITGDSGANVIDGGLGNDLLSGGGGNDTLALELWNFQANSHTIPGQTGTITLGENNAQTQAQRFLGGNVAESDTISGFENVIGSRLHETITGNSQANLLDGNLGDDKLFGGGGADTLIGGFGNDTMDGGAGADTFIYEVGGDAVLGNTVETILNFDITQDLIDIRALGLSEQILSIINVVQGGQNFSVFGVDVNGSGAFEAGEFAVAVNMVGNTFLTTDDFLI